MRGLDLLAERNQAVEAVDEAARAAEVHRTEPREARWADSAGV
jgi:hypothetical protein